MVCTSVRQERMLLLFLSHVFRMVKLQRSSIMEIISGNKVRFVGNIGSIRDCGNDRSAVSVADTTVSIKEDGTVECRTMWITNFMPTAKVVSLELAVGDSVETVGFIRAKFDPTINPKTGEPYGISHNTNNAAVRKTVEVEEELPF